MRINSSFCKGIMGIILLLGSYIVKSQENRVVFILADHQQPFYVRTVEKIYSSSHLGYAIMPRLKQGRISFTIGFPKNKWRSTKYNIDLGDNDLFLLLKQIDSSTWGLYDKQTNQVYIPEEVIQPAKTDTSKDPFSVMLAEVSDNPMILQQKKRETQATTVQDSEPGNPLLAITNLSQDSARSQQNLKETDMVYEKPKSVEKKRNKKQKIDRTMYLVDSTGLSMGFELIEDDVKENVVLFIPADSVLENSDKNQIFGKRKRKKQSEEKKEVVISVEASLEKKDSIKNEQSTKKVKCPTLATEADFRLFRKNLANEDDEETMILVADTTMFRSGRCYTTEQIKNLAVLFLNERLRFQFVETAIEHLSDVDNIKQLDNLFVDEQNKGKLKSAIEKKQR